MPIIIEQTHSIGIIAVISAIICFIFLLLRFKELYKCINNIGAKGTITVSLFAAVAFGGIVILLLCSVKYYMFFWDLFQDL
mgnify:CR=1 FL=1